MDDHPTMHPLLAWMVLRLSDLAVAAVIFINLAKPSFFGMDPEPARILGLSLGDAITGVGVAGVVIGWLWIRLIARGEPEPEANDRFWWSRA